MWRPILLVLLTSLLWPVAATAQSVVGTAIVNGERVELLSDHTWRPVVRSSGSGCIRLGGAFSACIGGTSWQAVPDNNPEIAALFRYDDTAYALVISESFGSSDGASHELMRRVVLQHAAEGSNTTMPQIPVLDVSETELLGQDAERIVYSVDFDGVEIVYVNTIMILPDRTFQFATYTLGQARAERFEPVHASFLATLRRD